MAQNINVGGDALLQQFLQQQGAARENNEHDKVSENNADEAAQRAIAKKAAERRQQVASQTEHNQQSHESFSSQQREGRAWQQMAEGRQGPELMQLAQTPNLQQKLNDKVKSMFAEAAQNDPARAAQAAKVLVSAAEAPGFSQAAPNTRMASDLAAKVLAKPALEKPIGEAMQGRFMRSMDGDAGAKQGLLRYASRQTGPASAERGVSVRMGGDMLEGLRQARVPGFGQRAAMDMIERNPNNRVGVETIDKFVQEAPIKQMPAQARGEAVRTLAKGDGAPPLATSLTQVGDAEAFRSLGREDKGRLFSTIGQGRPTELRAITDKTLEVLRSGRFPNEPRQVSRFLGGLDRQIKSGDGQSKNIDGKSLLRGARNSDMPKPPQLQPIAGRSDEDAEMARRQNRSSLMGYYNKLSTHYDNTEKEIAGAKHFLQANKVQGAKPPEAPDLSSLGVSAAAAQRIDAEVQAASAQAQGSRQLPRIEQIAKLRALQTTYLGQAELSTDEKTYAMAKTQHAMAAATFSDLSVKKARKVRDLRNTIGKPDPAPGAAKERRPEGVQRRYFTRGADAAGPSRPNIRMPSARAEAPQGQSARGNAALPGGARAAIGGAPPQAFSPGASARAPMSRADVRQLVSELDPKLSVGERIQQATEMISRKISARMQDELRQAANQVADEIIGQSGGSGERSARGEKRLRAGDESMGGGASKARTDEPPITSGQTDGYGIPRSQERDLGARREFRAVRPPGEPLQRAARNGPGEVDEPQATTGRTRDIVRSNTPVRSYDDLYTKSFKEMSKGETALLKSLDWDAQSWLSKNEPNARWPMAYQKSYSELSRREQQAVRQLDISPSAWDAQAAAMTQKK